MLDKKSDKRYNNFIEYEYVQENEYLVTIEYCANCEEHSSHTSHTSEMFKNIAINLQKCIMMRYPFIKVLLKPIDTDIELEQHQSNSILKQTMVIDNKYKEIRIGAMEIQLCFKKPGKNSEVVVVHSKIKTGNWPNINNVLNQIVAYVPSFNCDFKLFDKESNENELKNDEELNNLIGNKLLNIKMNIYKLKSKLIDNLCNSAREEIDNMNNPKKRKDVILSARRSMKESGFTQLNNNNNGKLTLPEFSTSLSNVRPPSSTTSKFFYDNRSSRNTFSNVSRPATTNMFNKSAHIAKSDKLEITDKETIASYKGELVRTHYSSMEGVVTINDLPHDSYLVEVEESSNYQTCALILNFKTINTEKCIHKFIGLNKQLNSFLQIFVYNYINNSPEEHLISDAAVTIKNISSNKDKMIFDEQEHKIRLKENSSVKGRYESVVVPGKYVLEVNKKGCGPVKKQLDVVSGENKFNVEMDSEKPNKIKVLVSSHDKFTPIENASVKICIANSENAMNSISNSKGWCLFEGGIKEEYITIYVEKAGYFPAQRTCVANGTNGEPKEVVVLLVKENYVQKENCIMMITYSNLLDDNFEPVYLFSDASKL